MKRLFQFLFFSLSYVTAFGQTNFRVISYEQALKTAQQETKLLFIDFYTDWCGPCKRMANNVFPQKNVGDYMNKHFVCIKLNAEKDGKKQAQQYKVTAYPTFIVIDTNENVKAELKGAMEPEPFIDKLTAALDPSLSPEKMKERFDKGDRSPKLVNAYALTKMEAGNEEEGFKIINDYFNELSDKKRLDKENSFLFTRYTIKLDDDKTRFMVAHRNEFDSEVKEQILNRISSLYHSEVVTYFSGYMREQDKFDNNAYNDLKKQITTLNLSGKYAFPPMFRLIEKRQNCDDASFLQSCKNEYENLSQTDKNLLIANITRLIPTSDKTVLSDMSSFIRSKLSTMDASFISMAGRTLNSIEEKMK